MNKRFWLFLMCIIAFLGGILTGFLSSRETKEQDIPTEIAVESVMGEDETVTAEKIKEINYYFVCISNDFLTVSRVFDDDSKEEIMTSYINITNLPESEALSLKEGVAFESMEDALMMAEAYVS